MQKLILTFVLASILSFIYADYATIVNQDGSVKPQILSSHQQGRMDALKNDIKFFHDKLGGLMAYLYKNRKDLFNKDEFSRNEIAFTEKDSAQLFSIVINKDTIIQTSGGKITSIKYKVRRGDMGPRESVNVVIQEVENKFTDDPREVKLRVYHLPLDHKETNPVESIDIDSIPRPTERLELVRHYKEGIRRTVRDLEQLIEHDQTLRDMTVWKVLKELD
jgi:hypothetical protein